MSSERWERGKKSEKSFSFFTFENLFRKTFWIHFAYIPSLYFYYKEPFIFYSNVLRPFLSLCFHFFISLSLSLLKCFFTASLVWYLLVFSLKWEKVFWCFLAFFSFVPDSFFPSKKFSEIKKISSRSFLLSFEGFWWHLRDHSTSV